MKVTRHVMVVGAGLVALWAGPAWGHGDGLAVKVNCDGVVKVFTSAPIAILEVRYGVPPEDRWIYVGDHLGTEEAVALFDAGERATGVRVFFIDASEADRPVPGPDACPTPIASTSSTTIANINPSTTPSLTPSTTVDLAFASGSRQ